MTDVSGIGSTSGSSAATSSSSSASASEFSNPQMFLQLLVAELQNQDPTNPTDPSTIMQQTAELSQVEAVNSMQTAISSEQTAAQQNEAAGLIGKSVTATVNSSPVTGTVSEVTLDASGNPTLIVDGTSVPLTALTTISAGSSTAGSGS